MKLRWFLSSTVRQASDVHKHVRKLLCAQRDILSPQAIEGLETTLKDTGAIIGSNAPTQEIQKQTTELEKAANKWLKPYPNSTLRENVEVLLVAIAVAMAVRTFFLQPFKIPTGSMQPTLFGVIAKDLTGDSTFTMPSLPVRVFDACVYGTFYHEMLAPDDGEIVQVPRVKSFLVTKQPIVVQYRNQSSPTVLPIWFAPDDPMRLFESGLQAGRTFTKGTPIYRFKETTGDHLFVNRLAYNFVHPKRGDITVFETKGIPGLPQDQFYIKRLVALPGETVRIGEDRHTYIDGKRLDSSVTHFENVYSFNPKQEPADSKYSGHILINPIHRTQWPYVQYFDSPNTSYQVRPDHYMVFGDNTANSLDSRYWGDFLKENVIGKSFFVYWPISGRFGWGQN